MFPPVYSLPRRNVGAQGGHRINSLKTDTVDITTRYAMDLSCTRTLKQ